jgi:hypothetical protein
VSRIPADKCIFAFSNYLFSHFRAAGYTPQKIQKLGQAYLDSGKSIAVDNMNSTLSQRSSWIALAKDHGIRVRALFLQTDKETCLQVRLE